jgi:hypothetical protein
VNRGVSSGSSGTRNVAYRSRYSFVLSVLAGGGVAGRRMYILHWGTTPGSFFGMTRLGSFFGTWRPAPSSAQQGRRRCRRSASSSIPLEVTRTSSASSVGGRLQWREPRIQACVVILNLCYQIHVFLPILYFFASYVLVYKGLFKIMCGQLTTQVLTWLRHYRLGVLPGTSSAASSVTGMGSAFASGVSSA